MASILVINPNSSTDCSAGIDAAVAPFRGTNGPSIEVATLSEGPPAIYTWQDWHAVVKPLCGHIVATTADVYVIACVSDPGIEAARAVTRRPVLGVFRSAVAAAIARGERFGVVAMVDASIARHRAALRAIGLEQRLAAEVALNVTMATLLDRAAATSRLIDAARQCADAGAESIILGCTGMAHHRAAIELAVGVPVIEPCQAAVALALLTVINSPASVTADPVPPASNSDVELAR
jgi:allantoin racemase